MKPEAEQARLKLLSPSPAILLLALNAHMITKLQRDGDVWDSKADTGCDDLTPLAHTSCCYVYPSGLSA